MNMITANIDRLYDIFKERELTVKQVTKEMGVNMSYFSNAKTRGTLNEVAIILLESKFNIPRELYVKKQTEEIIIETKPSEFVFTPELKKELYQILYSAMYHAVKQALND